MHNTVNLAISLSETGEPPSAFRIFAAGKVRTTKGTFLFDEQAAQSVMEAAQEWGNEFALDYAHAMVSGAALDPAEGGKAAGWFKPEVRNGELWATEVSWTPTAARHLKDREYRYISPAFEAQAVEQTDGSTKRAPRRITRLLNCALTNIPATHGLRPLVADQIPTVGNGAAEPGDKTMNSIAIALAAPGDAPESELLARVAAHRVAVADLCRLTGKEDPTSALSVVAQWRKDAAQAEALSEELESIRSGERAAYIADVMLGYRLPESAREMLDRSAREDWAGFQKAWKRPEPTVLAARADDGARTARVVPPSHAVPSSSDDGLPSPAELEALNMTAEQWRKTRAKMARLGVSDRGVSDPIRLAQYVANKQGARE